MPQTDEDKILIDLYLSWRKEDIGLRPMSRYAHQMHAIANLAADGCILLFDDIVYLSRWGRQYIMTKYPELED